MNPSLSIDEEISVFTKGAVDVIEVADLRARLELWRKDGNPLKIKLGADPSAPDIHLGHTVVLHKMRELQQLGHEVHFLIGDFTGRIGDPTGRSETRKQLSEEEVQANAETYKAQIHKILDPEKTVIDFNSAWLSKLSFADVIGLGAKYTVARLLERDDFSKRYKEGRPIGIHELFYPLAQGYDSVAMHTDVELGGTDQTFNLLVGRDLQRAYGQRAQVVLTMPLLEGLDGVQKMSKSLGNHVGINEAPKDIYWKTMSISDAQMWKWMLLLTEQSAEQVDRRKQAVADGAEHPMRVKEELAARLVEQYHGKAAAEQAAEEFRRLSVERSTPGDVPEVAASTLGGGKLWVGKLIGQLFTVSTSEARRHVVAGAFKIDGEKLTDPKAEVEPRAGMLLQLGKHKFVKLT